MHRRRLEKFFEQDSVQRNHQAADQKYQTSKAFAGQSFGAIAARHDHQQRTDADPQNSLPQHYVRRTEDFNVQPERVVPPVIEGRGSEHHCAAPASQERAGGSAKAPHFDGGSLRGSVRSEGSGENQVGRSPSRQNAAELNANVRRSPKGVAANGHVPGDVPDQTGDDEGHTARARPKFPGDGSGCGALLYRERRRSGKSGRCAVRHWHPPSVTKGMPQA